MNKILNLVMDMIYYRWKVFVFALVAVFAMVLLQHFKPAVAGSTAAHGADPFNSIRPRLEEKINDFHLKKIGGLVEGVHAAGDYTQAKAYVVLDLDSGEVLAEQNSALELPIASLTKIMTAVVALDLARPGDSFTVSERAAGEAPTKLGLVAGQRLTLEELLNGMLLTSANDAAQVAEEGINGQYGTDVFINAMNEKAKDLGLKNTHFENPQGFDGPGQYSSAEDLATLTGYALKNYPLIAQITKKNYQYYPQNKNHKQIDMYNWNGLLDVYPGIFGVKIGNTDQAGYTMVAGSQRNGKRVLAIILGAPGVLERDMWASEVLDLGFQKLGNLSPVNVTPEQLKEKYSGWKYWN